MLLGYARISAADRGSIVQLDALKAAGCERIFTDESTCGANLRRPGLDNVLADLSTGDVLVVWALDRLGCSLSQLVNLVASLGDKGIGFRSLIESVDTTTEQSTSLFRVMDMLVAFERSLIAERTRVGRDAANRRGVRMGRKPKLTPEKIAHAQRLIDAGESPGEVARSCGVSLATLYRYMPAAASNRSTFDLFSEGNQ